MKASSLFILNGDLPQGFQLSNQTYSTTEYINGVEETITTQLFVNETTQNGYTHCLIFTDEIIDVRARALQHNITQIIVQNSYDVYFNTTTGNLIVLSGRKIAERSKDVFQNRFGLNYSKYEFNMIEILNNSSNVKGTRFRDLTIETIRNGVLNGNKVDETELYELMVQNGTLYSATVMYPFGSSEVSFSVSNTGCIVLFSNLTNELYLDLLDELREL